MVVEDEFKSQPCKTIWYTIGEMLEGLRWCELLGPVQTHTILVRKVDRCKFNFDPTAAPQKHIVMTILEPTYQSQPCLTIHYNNVERLDGLSWYEMAESVCTHSILVWEVGILCQTIIFTTLDSKVGVLWRLLRMNSNLNHISPFSILMVKDWKGWDAVNCMNLSIHTHSGCKKWVWAKPNLYPLTTRK